MWKFVQRLKTLSASSSSPSSRRSLDLEGSRPSVEEVALKRKLEFGAPSKTEDEIAIYAAGSSRDAISISESPSGIIFRNRSFPEKAGHSEASFWPSRRVLHPVG